MDPELLSSYIIYRKELALKLGLNALFGGVMMIISLYIFKSNFLALFFSLLMILPLLFINYFFKKLRRKVIVKIEENLFSISILNGYRHPLIMEFNLDGIKAYNVQFPNKKFSTITFDLKVGKSYKYSFYKEKQGDEEYSGEDVIRAIYLLIKRHNLIISGIEKIYFKPSFFASRAGLVSIILLFILAIVAIIFHLIYQIKTLPVSLFFGIALLAQVIVKRKTEIEYFKKMK
jgi:hypothetical protein